MNEYVYVCVLPAAGNSHRSNSWRCELDFHFHRQHKSHDPTQQTSVQTAEGVCVPAMCLLVMCVYLLRMDGCFTRETGVSVDGNMCVTEHTGNQLITEHPHQHVRPAEPHQYQSENQHQHSNWQDINTSGVCVCVCVVPVLPLQAGTSVQVAEETHLHSEDRTKQVDLKDEDSNTDHTWTDKDRQTMAVNHV